MLNQEEHFLNTVAISYECNGTGVKNTWAIKNIVQLSPKAGRKSHSRSLVFFSPQFPGYTQPF